MNRLPEALVGAVHAETEDQLQVIEAALPATATAWAEKFGIDERVVFRFLRRQFAKTARRVRREISTIIADADEAQ